VVCCPLSGPVARPSPHTTLHWTVHTIGVPLATPFPHPPVPPQIIDFVEALLLNFDFDSAAEKLAACEAVIATDYFLNSFTSPHEFLEAGRRFIFETYCRIHEKMGLE